ncbi:MAG: hypothetical protein ACK5NN_14815 [Sphingomonadaceae bacterium]
MTDLPLLRSALSEQYAEADISELDSIVQSLYGEEATAEDIEGLFSDIGRGIKRAARGVGRFAQKAAPALARAAPAALAGAGSGAAFGPWGALIGAGAGLTGGLLAQSRNRTARSIGSGIGRAGGLVASVRGGGPAGALTSVGSGAAGRTPQGRAVRSVISNRRNRPRPPGAATGGTSAASLAGLLARPELLQSLLASMLGSAGRQQIQVGGQNIPVHQMLGTLGTVARRAAAEAAEFDPDAEQLSPDFIAASEAFGAEIDDAEGRADTLLAMLALAPSIWARRDPPVVVTVPGGDLPYHIGEGDEDGEAWWLEAGQELELDEWADEDEYAPVDYEDIEGDDEDWGGEDWEIFPDDEEFELNAMEDEDA